MNTSVRLAAGFPQPLAEELIKRVAYVSAGIRNPRLSSDRCELMFDLIPTFEPQLESISAAVQDIAAKLTRDNRVLTFRTVATRETLPGSFASDPHPILEAAGELIPLGTGRYAFGPRLVSLMAVFERRIGRLAQALSAPSFSFPSLISSNRYPALSGATAVARRTPAERSVPSTPPTCSIDASTSGTSRRH